MFYIFVMLTRASFSFQMGKVSGAAELGVERVHVHVHILIGKESKYVPLFDFVLKCARATDFQTFYRPWEFYFKKHSTQLLFITNPELLISITEVLMSIESCWTICVFSCIVYITIITTPPGYVVVSNHDLSKNKFLYKVCFIYL